MPIKSSSPESTTRHHRHINCLLELLGPREHDTRAPGRRRNPPTQQGILIKSSYSELSTGRCGDQTEPYFCFLFYAISGKPAALTHGSRNSMKGGSLEGASCRVDDSKAYSSLFHAPKMLAAVLHCSAVRCSMRARCDPRYPSALCSC